MQFCTCDSTMCGVSKGGRASHLPLAKAPVQQWLPNTSPHPNLPNLPTQTHPTSTHTCHKGFVRYADMRQERSRVMAGLAGRHGEWVCSGSGPEATVAVTLGPSSGPAPLTFSFSWLINFDRRGRPSQQLALLPRAAWNCTSVVVCLIRIVISLKLCCF